MSKDGGPAFPATVGEWMHLNDNGTTLRDYFAGQAIVGMLANGKPPCVNGVTVPLAEASFLIADAMISAREARDE